MAYFDAIVTQVQTLREDCLCRLRAILESMNLGQLKKDVGDMQEAFDVLQDHNKFMDDCFEKSHFSTIAARFKNYKSLVHAMEVVSQQSESYKDLITSKHKSLNQLEVDLKSFKKKLKDHIEAQKHQQSLAAQNHSFERAEMAESLKMNLISPFYCFMKQRLPQRRKDLSAQQLNYIEIVAILQEEWRQSAQLQQAYQASFQ